MTFWVFSAIAQQKGVSAIPIPQDAIPEGTSRAVVIGISDYQNPDIPDLKYAHKDAEAFVQYLQSPAGGSHDEDHLQVLINEEATTARIAAVLEWLLEESEEGDQAIIYFSGHGDVETKTMFQLGYLLTWDSPARSYMAGAFPIHYLQAVVSTLTIERNVRLMLVTDACRAGKLAGNEIEGSQLTASNLSKQFANEIKILSCQPNEYSIEGEQWGGGRGAFSYHLIDGLYGLADRNNDMWVNLMEIGRYLEDHVSVEVEPMSQLPMTVGKRTEMISRVDKDLLALASKDKNNQPEAMNMVASRGSERDVLSLADERTRQQYKAFEDAVSAKQFLQPIGSSASDLYDQLILEPSLEPLYRTMTRNFATALQDDAQQTLNAWLDSDIEEIVQSGRRKMEKYQPYPAFLTKAADLLGEENYMHQTLLARKYLFDGYLTFLENPNNPDEKRGAEALSFFRKSLALQPESAHTWLFMSMVYANNLQQPDSAYSCAMKAAAIAPTWILPYTNLAFVLSNKYQRYEEAGKLLEKAMEINPASALVWNYKGTWHANKKEYEQAVKCYLKSIDLDASLTPAYNNLCLAYIEEGKYKDAEEMCQMAIELDSTYAIAFNNLGKAYLHVDRIDAAAVLFQKTIQLDSSYSFAYNNLGLTRYRKGEMEEARTFFEKAISLDPNYVIAHSNLGNVYRRKLQYAEAEASYLEAIRLDSTCAAAHNNLGLLYYLQQKLDLSVAGFKNAVAHDPSDAIAPYSLGCLFSLLKDIDASIEWLDQSLQKGYNNYDGLQSDADLEYVRQTEPFRQLMKQYFPDK